MTARLPLPHSWDDLRRWVPWLLPLGAATTLAAASDGYWPATVARMLPLALLAVSVATVTSAAGLPTLGQVAPYAAGAYTTARLALAGHTLAPVQLVAAALVGAVTAGLLGMLLVRHRTTVVLMLSLAVAELTTITAARWRTVSGGTDGLAGIPAPRLLPGTPALTGDRPMLLYATAVTVAATAATMQVLYRHHLLLTAVRGNESRAAASGHPVTTYLWLVHTGAGAIAGTAGALLIHTHRWITPADVGFDTAALALLAAVIGGAHSPPGAAVAAVLVLGVRDVAAADWPGHAPLLLGALFVAAVYLLPGGLTAVPTRLRTEIRRVRATRRPEPLPAVSRRTP
ncbi:branched-chain amino acid ABC transporter permease [Micromonospora antibiotica]|uniref:Branched-chain amino acid ABC transporter permease n=1 Tax=Micromonospora antibiotica TaxID=2807623 RepID=A0ABS3VFI3_9ACTN|nr:branched-chain amino acid ABC transporter permease [Micromonospora antibiotica]MBO4164395.1 branched-chain amino acid ABC transporter permease [Micromonospora antibiotica]